MTAVQNLLFERFFCGPPSSANGGYAAGVTAGLLGERARVSLPKPPPVERALTAELTEAGVRVFDGDELVLAAKPRRGRLDVRPPQIDIEKARAAPAIPEILANHRAPTCLVCGPGRTDGFRILPGSLGAGVVATSWRVPRLDRHEGDEVAAPIVWAALDCPGGWCFEGAHTQFVPVLVSQSVDILKPIRVGDHVIVVAWATGRAERILRACTALLDLGGETLAVSSQTCVAAPVAWAR